jgi:hypothetical protein
MHAPPEDHKPSPIGVAVSPDSTPWQCPSCSAARLESGDYLHVDAADCPGVECWCGHNDHGRNIVTLDGGVRLMPEFAARFGRRTAWASVRIEIRDP